MLVLTGETSGTGLGHESEALISRNGTCMLGCSVLSDSVTPRSEVHQAPLSMEFSKQDYWSALPLPPPGDLPDPGIEPSSPGSPTFQVNPLLLNCLGIP